MRSDEIRTRFLKFFEERDHIVIASSSLIPHGDPTLLLTSAGMAQFKPYYLGIEKPPHPKLASCQKCFRTTDIEVVGDTQHLTFFEMLGNFSIADYFKKEAISWAWEFVTDILKIPEERLWITIYLDDDEAGDYWQQVGVPAGRIHRFGEDHNFWGPAGNSGPCGPCSEIHYDFGKEFGCEKPDCGPNCDCGRFCEIWNLVFTQYNQDLEGKRTPLEKPNIDTGMGLERIAMVMQGKHSVYETDLFEPIIGSIHKVVGSGIVSDEIDDRAVRVIAEHGRSMSFLIGDGVLPSNEGRGYVLRRILRRASLFGRRIGLHEPFLGEIAEVTAEIMGDIYPELYNNKRLILEVIKTEEKKFISTLETGLGMVENLIEEAVKKNIKELSGEQVFRLYDTYGFPYELTEELADEKGLSVNHAGFETEMEMQRQRGRGSARFTQGEELMTDKILVTDVDFRGYEMGCCQSNILDLRMEGKSQEKSAKGDVIDIIIDNTPFYAEMGGQAGDTGTITAEKGKVAIDNTSRNTAGIIIHHGRVVEGEISVGEMVEAAIDSTRRMDIARNHTSTHLLQAALRDALGSHVGQRGSSVEPDRFRFDFSHIKAISQQEIFQIQRWVNNKIRENLTVKTEIVPYDEAIKAGAIALFEEKYENEVRVVKIGDPAVSMELCGGTHVQSTGQIGQFLITGESSIGTGMYRIEAVTGRTAEELVEKRLQSLQHAATEMETSIESVFERTKTLVTELDRERKHTQLLERELALREAESLQKQVKKIGDVNVLAARTTMLSMPAVREMADKLRDKTGSIVLVLALISHNNVQFLSVVTPDLVSRGLHAGDIVKQIAKITGGGGGGKATMAQAGGRDITKVDKALQTLDLLVSEKIS